MDIKKLEAGEKEVTHLKGKLKRTYLMSRAIWEHREDIEEIKSNLDTNLEYAMGVWNDLDYYIQALLITAPRFGGVFTTQERAKITENWTVTVEEMEA